MSPEIRRTQTTELTLPLREKLDGIQKLLDYYGDLGLDPRLFGSFGREASLDKYIPTAIHERSDIDITLMKTDRNTSSAIKEAQEMTKHHLCIDFFRQIGGASFLKYGNVLVPIDPKILELRVGSLAGETVNTFDPNLLFHFSALFPATEPKHRSSSIRYLKEMRKNGNYLPEEMFEPFHFIMDLKKTYKPKPLNLNDVNEF